MTFSQIPTPVEPIGDPSGVNSVWYRYLAGVERFIRSSIGGTFNTPASTTNASSLNIATGIAPTAPKNGDVWFDGSNLFIRIGGVTKTFTVT